jgi:hypothetical protein
MAARGEGREQVIRLQLCRAKGEVISVCTSVPSLRASGRPTSSSLTSSRRRVGNLDGPLPARSSSVRLSLSAPKADGRRRLPFRLALGLAALRRCRSISTEGESVLGSAAPAGTTGVIGSLSSGTSAGGWTVK